jgi:hypothetical protein
LGEFPTLALIEQTESTKLSEQKFLSGCWINEFEEMREKQRYILIQWKKIPAKLTVQEFESIFIKEFQQKFGDFGLSILGSRFRIFPIVQISSMVIKVRIESLEMCKVILSEFQSSLKIQHISGSATLCHKVLNKKLKLDMNQINEIGIW